MSASRFVAGVIVGAGAAVLLVIGCGATQETDSQPRGAAGNGVEIRTSQHSFDDTVARVEAGIENRGLKLVAQIDHRANAANAELTLRPTMVFVFGNPLVGTPLMNAAPTIAMDLPQKLLVWQDGDSVQVAFNDPFHLATRHGLMGEQERLQRVSALLAGLAEEAAE